MRSIRLRLAILSLVTIAAAMSAVWFALEEIFEHRLAVEFSRQLKGTTDFLAGQIDYGPGGASLAREPADSRYLIPAGGRYWQVEIPGETTLRSRSLWDVEIDLRNAAPSGYGGLDTATGPDGEPLLLLHEVLILETAGGDREVYVSAAMARSEFDDATAGFAAQLRTMLLMTGLGFSAAAVLQLVVGLGPLRSLQQSVSEVRAGRASRVSPEGPSEIEQLVNEVNQLLDIRENDIANARNRASDLAHGIKTPLTILAQIAETVSRKEPGVARQVSEQVEAIRIRVERQLTLARMAANRKASADLGVLAEKLVAIARRLPGGEKLDWRIAIEPGLTAPIEEGDLAEALGNVLDNARKWARSRVEIGAGSGDRHVWISVCDDGSGISSDDGARVFGRGVRLDEAQSETGLGLAICREIIEAYHGRVEVVQSPLGGFALRMELPVLS